MPDPSAVAATHDMVQILFYFVCGLGFAISGGLIWFGKYMLLPFRDQHFSFLNAQIKFMDAIQGMLVKMDEKDDQRGKMHQDNLRKLSDLHRVAEEIKSKINCPPDPIKGAAGHA